MMTIHNEIVEAPMSQRIRYFEYRPYRPIVMDYFRKDPSMIITSVPKPLMRDDSYNPEYWLLSTAQRRIAAKTKKFCLKEEEIFFDAADCLLLGKMMFVQISPCTNLTGFAWLKRHFEPKGIEVAILIFVPNSNICCIQHNSV